MSLFNPNDHTSGQFIDDIDVEFTNCQCVMTDYDGHTDEEVPVFQSDLIFLDDPDREPASQSWSAGGNKNWVASEDGTRLEPADGSTKKSLTKRCKLSIFLQSLVDAGFPVEELEKDDITVLNGLRAHVVQQEMPKMNFNRGRGRGDDEEKAPPSVIVVESIISLPGEGKSSKKGTKSGKAAAATKTRKAAPKEDDFDVEAETEAAIVALLEAAEDGVVKFSKLPKELMKSVPGPNKTAIAEQAMDKEWIEDKARPFGYDAKTSEVFLAEED